MLYLKSFIRGIQSNVDIRYIKFYFLFNSIGFFIDMFPEIGDSFERGLYLPLLCLTIWLIFLKSFVMNAIIFVSSILYALIVHPANSNHLTFITVVNLFTLFHILTSGYSLKGKKSFAILHKNFILKAIAVLYFFTFFHKINSGFLNPMYSCANAFLESVSLNLTNTYMYKKTLTEVSQPYQIALFPYLALFVEFLLFLLFVIPRFRKWGAGLGIVVHGSFIYFHVYDFSFYILGFYVLALREDTFNKYISNFKLFERKKFQVLFRFLFILSLVIIFPAGFIQYVKDAPELVNFIIKSEGYIYHFFFFVFLTLSFLLLKSSIRYEYLKTRQGSIFIGCIITIGFLPYFGATHTPTFSMFSNLVVFENKTNHLLFSDNTIKSINLLAESSVKMTFVKSNDKLLNSAFEDSEVNNLFTFKRRLNEFRDLKLRKGKVELHYKENDQLKYSPTIFSDSKFELKENFWSRKIFQFRIYSREENLNVCKW